MTRDKRILWAKILAVLALCTVLLWLIGPERIVRGSDVVRDRLFLGVGR